jgi:hypothetical protein
MTVPKESQPFVDMIEKIMKDKAFYFSYQLDLSKSIQSNIKEIVAINSNRGSNSAALDQRYRYPNTIDYQANFVFNNYLLKPLDSILYAPFKVPCIYGYLFVRTIQIDAQKRFDFALVSKKDVRRPGRRFIVRGIDREGNVANFVESEHIITVFESNSGAGEQMKVATYIQTRGSIPAIWS